ncbi:50S ribosomal protein L31 [Salinivibrio sp. AR647]|uniref:type B 50S ribosomal protein L31 n=1 Tax=Salinivibrio sp. AR647 TaxID=1909438 RepID=UPI00098534E7|nr:type B 50S ribosomal protein L31 [Salinivibrio sp. AR647]OOE89178.1 50S ribosomal protein L31 [Salinivibrio sp. AR647]
MQANIHPEYRPVVFHDTSVDAYFIIGSTLQTSRTIEWQDGKTYPYYPLDISNASHPVYTGKQRAANKEGRAANFARKFGQIGRSQKASS